VSECVCVCERERERDRDNLEPLCPERLKMVLKLAIKSLRALYCSSNWSRNRQLMQLPHLHLVLKLAIQSLRAQY